MELFRLFGKIAVDNAEADQSIDNTTEKAEKSHPRISGAFAKVGSAAVAMGKVMVTWLAAGATALGALTTQALKAYSDYEQLVGGVETLFKESSNMVVEYANNAYKTAGMSANEYMETVTSFSASLLQSLDGDTAKAGNVANQAIIDMADNANKMGTSMESIQNAYQGFAKQNYTMLDNLKLGYGGTKEEMERLLADAEKISGIKYDISSFADITEAIHVIQTEMDITGTTSKEAASTIQGSLGMMKSAWSNMVTGMADSSQNQNTLIKNFTDSVVTAANNILPRILETIPRLIEGLSAIAQKLVPYIPEMIGQILPALIDGARILLTELAENLPSILEELLPGIGGSIGEALSSVFSQLMSLGEQLLPMIMEFAQAVMPIISELLNQLLPPLMQIVSMILPVVMDLLMALMPLIQALMPLLEPILNLLLVLLEPLIQLLDLILPPLIELVTVIVDKLVSVLAPTIEFIAKIIGSVLNSAFETIPPIVMKVFNSISTWFTKAKETIVTIFTQVKEKIHDIWQNGIWATIKGVINMILGGVENMVNGVVRGINTILGGIDKVVSGVGDLLGLNWSVPTLSEISLPRLEQGGVLEKGQVGLLEGNGAEAVVPLENNRKWISKVSEEMQVQGIGGSDESISILKDISAKLQLIIENMPDDIRDAIENGLKLNVNNREFARMVKAVN